MTTTVTCPIWKMAAATEIPTNRDGKLVHSTRAGGRYFVTNTALADAVVTLTDLQKAKLSSWIAEQNRFGATPEITTTNLPQIISRRALTPHERADRLLQGLANTTKYLGEPRYFEVDEVAGLGGEAALLMADAECVNAKELKFLLEHLMRLEFIRMEIAVVQGFARANVTVQPAGYVRLQEISAANIDSAQAFVAMWFSERTRDAYDRGIEPAIRKSGYRALRIDRKEHSNKIDDEIIAEIRRSRFLVADFTSEVVDLPVSSGGTKKETIARGGVYYEAGFAQGRNIPVIWTCRADIIPYIHFDTRQFNHITWSTPEELYDALRKRIGAVIGDGPLK